MEYSLHHCGASARGAGFSLPALVPQAGPAAALTQKHVLRLWRMHRYISNLHLSRRMPGAQIAVNLTAPWYRQGTSLLGAHLLTPHAPAELIECCSRLEPDLNHRYYYSPSSCVFWVHFQFKHAFTPLVDSTTQLITAPRCHAGKLPATCLR
jgi:hypothetical protein